MRGPSPTPADTEKGTHPGRAPEGTDRGARPIQA